mmetsp:Transcript_25517/g.87421  ORF Transcript_25517/g.87421 Transcript_25517/m.87421 type:complete len:254 (+) Transcript_25517:670-1431(+)
MASLNSSSVTSASPSASSIFSVRFALRSVALGSMALTSVIISSRSSVPLPSSSRRWKSISIFSSRVKNAMCVDARTSFTLASNSSSVSISSIFIITSVYSCSSTEPLPSSSNMASCSLAASASHPGLSFPTRARSSWVSRVPLPSRSRWSNAIFSFASRLSSWNALGRAASAAAASSSRCWMATGRRYATKSPSHFTGSSGCQASGMYSPPSQSFPAASASASSSMVVSSSSMPCRRVGITVASRYSRFPAGW